MRDLWELLPLRYVQFNECLHVLHCLFLLIQICSVWQPHEHQLGTPLREAIAAIIDLKWANSRIFKKKAAVWLTRPSLRVKEILLSSRPSSGSSFYAKTNKKTWPRPLQRYPQDKCGKRWKQTKTSRSNKLYTAACIPIFLYCNARQ